MIGFLKLIFIYCLIVNLFTNCSLITQYYYISNNNVKCSLINLSAYVNASYGTDKGNRFTCLSIDNQVSGQNGICGTTVNNSFSEFNISLNGNEYLNLYFKNQNNFIYIASMNFIYKLPNVQFPNATSKGMVTASTTINKPLSSSSQFYQCSSYTTFSLSHGVTVHINFIKLRVFNVTDESFGNEGAYCPEDKNSSARYTSLSTVILTGTQSSVPNLRSTTTQPSVTTTAPTTTFTTNHFTTSTAANSSADPKFVIENDIVACLLLQSKMTLSISYQRNNGEARKQYQITNHSYSGVCGEKEDNVNISISDNIFVNFRFNKIKNTTKLYRLEISSDNKVFIFKSEYKADVGTEYYCKTNLRLGNETLNLQMANFRFEAFRTSKQREFSNKISGTCVSGGLSTGQIFSILLFGLMVTILLGLSLISLIRKCLRYYRYQKVLLHE